MAKHRPSLQLMVDRKLAMRFRGFCLQHGTSASAVIGVWMEDALRTGKLPPVPAKPKPRR